MNVSKATNGEITIVMGPEDVPANPENAAAMTEEERDAEHARRLHNDPAFEPGHVAKSWIYHDQISFEDELGPEWGKRWGAQGIGRLREVMLNPPTENDVRKVFYDDKIGYSQQWDPDSAPDLDRWLEQYEVMKKNYRDAGVLVHELILPEIIYGPYGYTRWIWAATDAGWVVNGGAVIPRGGYHGQAKGRNPIWQKALALLDIPILYSVRGYGVAELGGEVWLDNHHLIVSDGTIMNLEGARQLKQIFEMSDAKLVRISTAGHYEYTAFPSGGTSHVDMVVGIPDIGKVVLYPPYTGYATVKFFARLGYDIIEVPAEEYLSGVYNMVVIEPGVVMCPTNGAPRTIKKMQDSGIEIIPTEMTESMKAGGAVHCSTCQLVRDEGPVSEVLLETPLEELAPELLVPEWEKDWTKPAWRWSYSIDGLNPNRPYRRSDANGRPGRSVSVSPVPASPVVPR